MEQFRNKADADYLFALRHSAAHLMAQAVLRIYKNAKLTVGPATEDGFFYDIDLGGQTLSPEDLTQIELEMKKIVKENFKVTYSEKERSDAKAFVQSQNQSYKLELIDSIPAGEPVTFYSQGEFTDLCEGPHVRHTGELKHFKLLYTSGAYWKADQNNAQLQRIYGTVFATKDELDAHLKMLEEAKRRDHRELGKKLELFLNHEWAPGSPFFLPNGTFVLNAMMDYIREIYRRRGYKEVITPQLFDSKLYQKSGHIPAFQENMFQVPESEHHSNCLKPMNCPGHCLLYKMQLFSYRDLPLRIAEFSKLHRNEVRGALHGITRVRGMQQDDAHIFCTEDQIESETEAFFEFVDEVYKTFGLGEYSVKLSLRPDVRIGSDEAWTKAETILENMLKKRKITYSLARGEGAIYGPKYEFHVKDAIGRSWQLATLQLDFPMPERFDLEYVGDDSKRHRPVMLHRAVLGTLERFFGVYLEHCEGYFPTWLAPTQIYLVPIRDTHVAFAKELEQKLTHLGVRVVNDADAGNMGGKVRKAINMRVPYIAVIGDRELEARSVALKSSREENFGTISESVLIENLQKEIAARSPHSLFKI